MTSFDDQSPRFSFDPVETQIECLATRERKEQLMQYNLDQAFKIQKFRFTGNFSSLAGDDYNKIIKDFFSSSLCLSNLNITGLLTSPFDYQCQDLGLNVMSLEFFDRLSEHGIVGSGGRIKGCFDEVYDGITVGDLLRELLLNENSENSCLFSDTDKNEFIYQLFHLFAVGGSLCQPDHMIDRYLDITKSLYKELITVYKDSKTEKVEVSGRIYRIEKVNGLELFEFDSNSPHNRLFIYIDPIKRLVTVLKHSFKPFW